MRGGKGPLLRVPGRPGKAGLADRPGSWWTRNQKVAVALSVLFEGLPGIYHTGTPITPLQVVTRAAEVRCQVPRVQADDLSTRLPSWGWARAPESGVVGASHPPLGKEW